MAHFNNFMTVVQARNKLQTLAANGGCECPVCDQHAQEYRRQIHSSMARTLIRMFKAAPLGDWIYLPNIPQKSRDSAHMAHWGLIVEADEKREDGGRAGWWRVTNKGGLFVLKLKRVPKYALVYDGHFRGFQGEPVSIVDCLGTPFDYRQLMDS